MKEIRQKLRIGFKFFRGLCRETHFVYQDYLITLKFILALADKVFASEISHKKT